MSHSHAIVWMDSKEAHILKFNAADVEAARVRSHLPFRKLHHKAGAIGSGHEQLDHAYFEEIAQALDGVEEWILVGPSGGKEQMEAYVGDRLPQLRKRLLGVESLDHPTDGQLVDHARRFFKAADRMRAI